MTESGTHTRKFATAKSEGILGLEEMAAEPGRPVSWRQCSKRVSWVERTQIPQGRISN